MAVLLIFGIANIVLAVYFWSKELDPFLKNIHRAKLTKYEIINIFIRLGSLCINLYRLTIYGKYLVIDMCITMFSVSMLGFGDAVSGGILGLALSNCISILILSIMKKQGMLGIKPEVAKG